ncbi:NACHT domain-containing protein [Fusarium sp. LHS14.1]|nr:NACHT domain-containing protein [Fusarium sp. LHS14.1]
MIRNPKMLDILEQVPEGLTNLYDRMWRQVSTQRSRNSRSCKAILVAVFLAYRPLQLQELPMLAGFKGNLASHDTIVKLVRRCGSFLTIQQGTETVHFVHQSAKDFLRDNKDILDGMFPTGMGDGHHQLFSRSLTAMTAPITGLRQDIYGLHNPGVLSSEIERPVPDPLAAMRYSCVRWLDHFSEWVSLKQVEGQDGAKEVATFLEEKYLYWLEALGLCGSLTEGIVSIRKLEALATRNRWDHLAIRIRDAQRFALANKRGIEIAPLQVYVSALIFCPTSSWIREKFKELIPEWIKKGPKIQLEWDACLLTLEGHDSGVEQVAFSPDSRIIASSDQRGTIKIWDAYTGACLNTISDRRAQIVKLAFLSAEPSIILASAGREFGGCSIKIWNPFNGSTPLRTLFMLNKMSNIITFIASSKTAVWMDEAGTLIKFDLDTGKPLDEIKLPSMPIAVSPDGQIIITQAEHECCCHVWDWSDPETARLTLDDCSPYDDYMPVFSPDSTNLVAYTETLRYTTLGVWDLTRGACTALPSKLDSSVARLAFSPDGAVVAFADMRDTVSLWDITTNTSQVFSGHRDVAWALAISPDGRLLASGCADATIKILDLTIKTSLSSDSDTRLGPKDWLLSPNGLWAASLINGNVLRIWSSVTGEYAFEIREPRSDWDCKLTRMLEFSPCDRWLAFFLPDGLKIWDTTTWKIQGQFRPGFVWNSSLSSNNLVLLLDGRNTVEIWDLHACKLISTFSRALYRHGFVENMAFYPNGLRLELASRGNLEIWDCAAKECIQVVNRRPDIISWEDKRPVQLTNDGEWVTVKGKRVLWVPSQYRPRFTSDEDVPGHQKAVDCNESGIAILDNCDRVIYIDFDVPKIVLNF